MDKPTDWRALCAELLEIIEGEYEGSGCCAELRLSARAALDQPEPQRPTVMEIIALADEVEAEGLGQVDLVRRALARWGRPAPVPAEGEVVEPTDEELWQVGDEDFRANTWPTDAIRYARAVLARWGRPAIKPVPTILAKNN